MNPQIESDVAELRDYLASHLNPLREKLGGLVKTLWDQSSIDPLLAPISKIRGAVKEWEDRVGPVDWNSLESWINAADNDFRRQCREHHDSVTALGMNALDTYPHAGNFDAIHEKLLSYLPLQALRRLYGPNWRSCEAKLGRLGYDIPSDNCAPNLAFRNLASECAEKIIRYCPDKRCFCPHGDRADQGHIPRKRSYQTSNLPSETEDVVPDGPRKKKPKKTVHFSDGDGRDRGPASTWLPTTELWSRVKDASELLLIEFTQVRDQYEEMERECVELREEREKLREEMDKLRKARDELKKELGKERDGFKFLRDELQALIACSWGPTTQRHD